MVWLQESIRQRTSHLDIRCHVDSPKMSNNKTIRGDNDERMKAWNATRPHVKTGTVAIKRRILKCDSLSPLVFCLALMPLTNMLDKQGTGYEIKGRYKVSHLFCTDDLKLLPRGKTKLQ